MELENNPRYIEIEDNTTLVLDLIDELGNEHLDFIVNESGNVCISPYTATIILANNQNIVYRQLIERKFILHSKESSEIWDIVIGRYRSYPFFDVMERITDESFYDIRSKELYIVVNPERYKKTIKNTICGKLIIPQISGVFSPISYLTLKKFADSNNIYDMCFLDNNMRGRHLEPILENAIPKLIDAGYLVKENV